MLKHSDTKLIKRNTVDQNLEGERACFTPGWIRHCIELNIYFQDPNVLQMCKHVYKPLTRVENLLQNSQSLCP